MDENIFYWGILGDLREEIYRIFIQADRNDLIFVYELKQEKIYSYIFEEYMAKLNERSRQILQKQYAEARQNNEIVVFIRDELRQKMKSFTI